MRPFVLFLTLMLSACAFDDSAGGAALSGTSRITITAQGPLVGQSTNGMMMAVGFGGANTGGGDNIAGTGTGGTVRVQANAGTVITLPLDTQGNGVRLFARGFGGDALAGGTGGFGQGGLAVLDANGGQIFGRLLTPSSYWMAFAPSAQTRPEVQAFVQWVTEQAELTCNTIGASRPDLPSGDADTAAPDYIDLDAAATPQRA